MLTALVALCYACSSDDEGSGTGTDGNNINFDLIAIQPRLSDNMYQFNRVDRGEIIGPAQNFIEESGRLELEDYILLDDQLVFYNDFGSSNEVVYYDVNTETVRVVPPVYFRQSPEEDYINRRKGVTKDYIITTFFKFPELDIELGAPFYAMKYDLATETITEFPIIDRALDVTRITTSDKFLFVFYVDDRRNGLVVIDTETNQIVQDLILFDRFEGIRKNVGVDGTQFVVQNSDDKTYQIIDLNTGNVTATGTSDVTFASLSTLLFNISITDSRLYIDLAAAQPSPISGFPAYVERSTGELFILDTGGVQRTFFDQYEGPPFLSTINGFAIDAESGIVVYGITLQEPENPNLDGGLIYTNFEGEILKILPVPGGETNAVLILD